MIYIISSHLFFCLFIQLVNGEKAQTIETSKAIEQNGILSNQYTVKNLPRNLPTYQTVWEVDNKKPIIFYLWPSSNCQSVLICDYIVKPEAKQRAGSGIRCEHGTSLLFNPLEQTVYDGSMKQYIYPKNEVLLQKNNEIYELDVWNNYNGTLGKPSRKLSLKITRSLFVQTSSPYCHIIISQITSEPSYYMILTNTTRLPTDYYIPSGQLGSTKRFNGLIIDSVLKNGFPLPNVEDTFCSLSRSTDLNTGISMSSYNPSNLINLTPSIFLQYNFSQPSRCDRTDPKSVRYGFYIDILNPISCPWLRICFMQNKGTEACTSAENSLEILPLAGIFIPIDSDSARSFGVERSQLTVMEVTYRPAENTMFLGYGMSSMGRMMIYEPMYYKWKLEKKQYVVLARPPTCQARLVSAHQNYVTKLNSEDRECLEISGCDILHAQ